MGGDGSGGNASGGEWQMKLCSLVHLSPPAVRPGSSQAMDQYQSAAHGLRTPVVNEIFLLHFQLFPAACRNIVDYFILTLYPVTLPNSLINIRNLSQILGFSM